MDNRYSDSNLAQIDYCQMLLNSAKQAGMMVAALKVTGIVDGIHVTDHTLVMGALVAIGLQNIIHVIKPPRTNSKRIQ